MPVYRGMRIAHWRGHLSKHKLAAWFPNPNDLRVWDLVPDSPCPADHGSGNASGQDEETPCSRFHRWCSCSQEALRCARVEELVKKTTKKKASEHPPIRVFTGLSRAGQRGGKGHVCPTWHPLLPCCSPPCSPRCSPALGAEPCSCLSLGLPPAVHLGVGRRHVQDNPGYLLEVFFTKPLGNPLNQSY